MIPTDLKWNFPSLNFFKYKKMSRTLRRQNTFNHFIDNLAPWRPWFNSYTYKHYILRVFWPNALNSHTFMFSRSKLVRKGIFFRFILPSVFMIFQTVILIGSLWRRTLICNPLSKKCWENSHAEFRENRVKTVAVTVLPFFQIKMAAVTSAIMIMSQNSNDRYLHL